MWGRVLPLLEVGAGFHDELTGRENVYLLGAILGLSQREIEAAMPTIVEFAGVERHMDTPLKRYSSGMQARLSFATAICFPADIYVFDEVLAVVDDDFRDRASTRAATAQRRRATIIFMSHDLDLVTEVVHAPGCGSTRAGCGYVGSMEEVAAAYHAGVGAARGAVERLSVVGRARAGRGWRWTPVSCSAAPRGTRRDLRPVVRPPGVEAAALKSARCLGRARRASTTREIEAFPYAVRVDALCPRGCHAGQRWRARSAR